MPESLVAPRYIQVAKTDLVNEWHMAIGHVPKNY